MVQCKESYQSTIPSSSVNSIISTTMNSFTATIFLFAYVILTTSARILYRRDVPSAPCKVPDSKLCFSITSYTPLSLQYHSQNENRKNVFGYAYLGQAAGQAAYNVRNANGFQVGSWAYMNPEGKEINVAYVSDSKGYRVMSNDLPIAPTETPEVVALRAKHMAAHAALKTKTTELVEDNPKVNVDPEDEEAAIEINAAQMEFMKVFREIRAF